MHPLISNCVPLCEPLKFTLFLKIIVEPKFCTLKETRYKNEVFPRHRSQEDNYFL